MPAWTTHNAIVTIGPDEQLTFTATWSPRFANLVIERIDDAL